MQVVTRVPRFETSETKYRGDVLLGFDTADLGKTVRATLDAGNRQLAMSVNAGYHTAIERALTQVSFYFESWRACVVAAADSACAATVISPE